MTREAMLNRDALDPRFVKYNPCYYCKKASRCMMECRARIGFNFILEDHLTFFYRSYADERAIAEMMENARKYKLPI